MCSNCSWQEFLEEIEELSADERYEFAAGTLEAIHNWVEECEHATDNQKKAIANIRNSRVRTDG
jgi:predicted house-cleaning noncanonical NTP pyrophosphatase (MazG superfamily)